MKVSSEQIEFAFEWLNDPKGTANLILLGQDPITVGPYPSGWSDPITVIPTVNLTHTVTLTRSREYREDAIGGYWVRHIGRSPEGQITIVGQWRQLLTYQEAMTVLSGLAEASV